MIVFYSKFRIGLMTFALGLASVFMMNCSIQISDDIPVMLPKIQTESPIIVFPRHWNEKLNGSYWGGGGADGGKSEKIYTNKNGK